MKPRKNTKLLKNPYKIRLDSLGAIAEARGIYSVDSMREGLMYFYNDGEYMIATSSKGYVRLSEKEVGAIISELPRIVSDIEYLRRAERRN